jgi:hypothetical protein
LTCCANSGGGETTVRTKLHHERVSAINGSWTSALFSPKQHLHWFWRSSQASLGPEEDGTVEEQKWSNLLVSSYSINSSIAFSNNLNKSIRFWTRPNRYDLLNLYIRTFLVHFLSSVERVIIWCLSIYVLWWHVSVN